MSIAPIAEEILVVHATADQIERIHEALGRMFGSIEQAVSSSDHGWWMQFVTAVGEISANVVRHAYPAGPGNMEMRLRWYGDRVEARFLDQGVPYRPPDHPPPRVSDDLIDLPEGGYGLTIARAALDVLEYQQLQNGDNCWLLMKKLPAELAG